ncbi:DUF1671-domain-containing protein [Lentinus tigrinus ALCF2SS1-7]|uniref:DUF1671-domain-containing protein n=1 Tax=Lentinus tigrinus ALCF2SS1-7 TaxID=1328758 RepID=UPI001165E66D|nr:DUF1671-domain-containing protein [Lentinus tigrinus ALCF2SS1-7]
MPATSSALTDDEIEIVDHNIPNEFICQLCSQDLGPLTIPQRQYHYDEHLLDEPQASGSNLSGGATRRHKSPGITASFKSKSVKPVSKTGFNPLSFAKGRSVTNEGKNVFWHASLTVEPPSNFSPVLIPVLKRALVQSHERGPTERAWLCFEQAVHVQGEPWDRTWGCGYRNYLMACAALMDQQHQPMYFPLLDAPVPPGIRNFQILLERAWRDGYDEEGAHQLNRELLDTCKWIGTAELYVAFTYRGIPAQLVDFVLSNGVEPLLQWILNYFSGADPQPKSATVGDALRGARPVIVTDKLPIILQHNGHSRTIVGCERVKGGGLNLLTFDPAKRILSNIRQAGLQHHNPAPANNPSSPSKSAKVLHHVMHPVETIKSHKRKSPDTGAGSSKRKRIGSAPDDDNVIIITDDEEEPAQRPAGGFDLPRRNEPDGWNYTEVLKLFRIDGKSLQKQKKYQILYFPLKEPLSEADKRNRRVVTSLKIC